MASDTEMKTFSGNIDNFFGKRYNFYVVILLKSKSWFEVKDYE